MISYSYTIDHLLDYTNTVIVLIVIFFGIYHLSTSSFDKWQKLNVPHIRPIPFFGNTYKMSLKLEHQVDTFSRIYERFANEKYCGLYQMKTPYLMIRDPELINRIMVKDFSHFTDHGIDSTDPAVNVMANSLFFLKGQRWKTMRQKMNSGFTSSKLRASYNQIIECSDDLLDRIDETLKQSDNIEVKQIVGKFVTDVIGTCAFGLKLDTIKNVNSEFRIHARKIFQPSVQQLLIKTLQTVCPSLVKTFKLQLYPSDSSSFFYSVFNNVVRHRNENNVVRNDLMQTLMDTRKELVLNDNLSDESTTN